MFSHGIYRTQKVSFQQRSWSMYPYEKAGGCICAKLIRHLLLAQIMILESWDQIEPRVRFPCSVESPLLPLAPTPPPPPPLPLVCALALSLKYLSKIFFKNLEYSGRPLQYHRLEVWKETNFHFTELIIFCN